MDERRTAPRKRSFLKGTVYFNNRHSSLDCVIRDFSEDGARLEFAAPVSLPDVVELYIPTREQTLRAEVRWRSDAEVGVSFDAPRAAADRSSSGDLGKRVEALEHEMEKLRRLVLDLRADLRSMRGES